jgi:hypothetical protein
MNSSNAITVFASTLLVTGLFSCQQDPESRNAKVSQNKPSTLSNSVIARVSQDPSNANMGTLELVSSNQSIQQGSQASQVVNAFSQGQPLQLKKDGFALTASNPQNGSMFALYECPEGYYMPYTTVPTQSAANQPNIGIDNLFSTFSDGGSGLFNNLISGLGTSDGGGILESVSGTLQSLIGLFASGGLGTLGLPSGQTTVSNYADYGCVPINGTAGTTVPMSVPTTTPNTTTNTLPASTAPTTASPTPYTYMGQVQSGPYTYYTYALPSEGSSNGSSQTPTPSNP